MLRFIQNCAVPDQIRTLILLTGIMNLMYLPKVRRVAERLRTGIYVVVCIR